MTVPATGSVSISGLGSLLGGVAGQIDTTSLINSLMQAEALPQQALQNQLSVVQATTSAYQAINAKLSTLADAAQAVTDPAAWSATAATSSDESVLATSNGAPVGTTTFDVLALARAQVSTVAAEGGDNVVANPSAGIVIASADGTLHPISLTSGAATDVASAINDADVGVRASVLHTDSGTLLQLVSTTSGAAAAFTATGFAQAPADVVTAQDARIGVGAAGAGGYTISSATNTFTDAIPGVTFSVSALASNVSIAVTTDEQSISAKVQALVDAANAAHNQIAKADGKGAILQGSLDVQMIDQSLLSAISQGVADGGTLSTYGIDLDSTGTITFDADAFAAAYAADPGATRTAIAGSLATALSTTATNAIDPTTGTVSAAITAGDNRSDELNGRINDWTTRLADIRARMTAKYNAMETMLARLQSQSSYLTSMLKSLDSDSQDSSSS